MSKDISHRLSKRFGLLSDPTPDAIERWFKATEQLVAKGYTAQQAGDKAAQQVFPDCNRRHCFSQADTIEALLAELRRRT